MRASVHTPQPAPAGVAPLPSGSAVGSFVLRGVQRSDDFGICYRATSSASDSEVVIEEYLPQALARRDADGTLGPRSPSQAALWAEGLQAFLQESEQLSRLEHPSLLRIGPVWQARGTAYRLRVGGEGRPLAELVAAMTAPPDEAWLHRLLDPLLGALQAMHEAGWVHGNVRPSQIAMRADGSPVLLDSGAVRIAIGERLPETAGVDVEPGFLPPELSDASLDWPVGPWSDLHALAQVLRYCITGQAPLPADPAAPLADADVRPSLGPRTLNARYAPGLVAALERALVLQPRQRPQSVADFRHAVDAPVMLRAVPTAAPVRTTPPPPLSPSRLQVPLPPHSDVPRPHADAPLPRGDGLHGGVPLRAEAPQSVPRANTVPFSLDLARERAGAPREPAWAAMPAPQFRHADEQQAQVFDFHAAAAGERRVLPPRTEASGGRPARRWPWAVGGVLAGAALTAALVFFGLRPSAEVRFAFAPPAGAPATEVPAAAERGAATTPEGAVGGGLLQSTPLPSGPGAAAANGGVPGAAAVPAPAAAETAGRGAPATAAAITAAPDAAAAATTPAAPNAAAPNAAVPTATAPLTAGTTAAAPTAAGPMAAGPTAAGPTAAAPIAAAPTAAAPTAAAPTAARSPGIAARATSEVGQAAPAGPAQAAARAGTAGGEEAEPAGTEAAEPPGSPLAACSPRTNFSLYRCMQTQCERSQYYTHPQCIRLRVRDELP